MAIDRSNRVAFEEVADLYDEVRPAHPEVLIDDLVALSGIPENGRILEVGCGPGNATVAFAQRGYRILAIELGKRLAELARKNCRDFPQVTIENMIFEAWDVEVHAFDLAFSAEAFHWIHPDVGYPKIARAVKDSGSVALFWHVPVDPVTEWSQAIDKVYKRVAPELENPEDLYTAEWLIDIITNNFVNAGCYKAVDVRQYKWSEEYSGERYVKLLHTFSGHRRMDTAVQEKLYAEIQDVIESFGGSITKPMLTVLFHAKVKR